MTTNEIAYFKAQEEQRHNLATEAETKRNNIVVSDETNRHNLVYEGETKRHNIITENETIRSNLAREAETNRANMAQESEISRHNQVVEVETHRHNVVSEGQQQQIINETRRSNLANESIQRSRNAIQMAQVKETARHNVQTEILNKQANEITKNRDLMNYEVASRQAAVSETRAATEQSKVDSQNTRNTYMNMESSQKIKESEAREKLLNEQSTSESVLRNYTMLNSLTQDFSNITSGIGSLIPRVGISIPMGGLKNGQTTK